VEESASALGRDLPGGGFVFLKAHTGSRQQESSIEPKTLSGLSKKEEKT